MHLVEMPGPVLQVALTPQAALQPQARRVV
jgi:hypothetical protein